MRILLAKTFQPFLPSVSDRIALELLKEIQSAGHSCECLRIPTNDHEQSVRFITALELENTDRLVCLDEPCHHLRHPVRVLVQWDEEPLEKPTFTGTIRYEGVPSPSHHLALENTTLLQSQSYRFSNPGELLQFILI